ncbi:MAG: hypothetical protein UT39_C0025G0011 [Candidatus Woesebacteria bacterium GW2011_GWA1_39_21]|uniref:Uncharacterized protein n=1 Tax=Candidatus Woesebacteria bacterium GW2011_GWA1_39_21 TaxID=1618550 RepID=A0A0G0N3D0_9BACT|nr:MAG: hypothetical protein UT39_C0025G0011 [Candidatus Woesebacteria bacterium GW2011_GWA1_39_21]
MAGNKELASTSLETPEKNESSGLGTRIRLSLAQSFNRLSYFFNRGSAEKKPSTSAGLIEVDMGVAGLAKIPRTDLGSNKSEQPQLGTLRRDISEAERDTDRAYSYSRRWGQRHIPKS